MVKIAVVGAGANGLASAVKIQEYYKDAEVVIISKDFSPDTTGDGSGGLWYPYLCGNTPDQSLLKWGIETYKLYLELWREGEYNICLLPIYNLYKETTVSPPLWTKEVCGFQILNEDQMRYYNRLHNNEYTSGTIFSTFVVHPTSILKYLAGRFARANGKTLRAEVSSLSDPILAGFDIVVNCTGLGARWIVPDPQVFPIRGQISKVMAPWVGQVIIDEDGGNYIIPNNRTCVMGGTHQEHDYNTGLNKVDTEFVSKGCADILPGLKHAPLVSQWAGLRPGRHEVRLEAEERGGKLFIHNYGHGGSGLTLFWGCATDVLNLLKEKLSEKKLSKL